jgi:protein MpaA
MSQPLLVFGGFHGDEPKSVDLARRFAVALGEAAAPPPVIVVPLVNPDGFEIRKRRNARKVDINRNFPTRNWERGNPRSRMFGGESATSEPETRCVIELIKKCKPRAIITIHSISDHRFCNNYDGPAGRLARRMAALNHYPVTPSIGYPTPGSFGSWAGKEQRIPTITLELPSHHSSRRCWEDNREALWKAAL